MPNEWGLQPQRPRRTVMSNIGNGKPACLACNGTLYESRFTADYWGCGACDLGFWVERDRRFRH